MFYPTVETDETRGVESLGGGASCTMQSPWFLSGERKKTDDGGCCTLIVNFLISPNQLIFFLCDFSQIFPVVRPKSFQLHLIEILCRKLCFQKVKNSISY